jgi:hypothetical protein
VSTHEHASGRPPNYRFGGVRPDLDAAMAAIATLAAESRLTLVRLMNAHAVERLRTKAARAFSDAFLMRNRRTDA